MMNKLFVTLLLGMTFLFSGNLYAGNKYRIKPAPTQAPLKPRMPAFHPVIAVIDEETGELTIMFNTSINSVDIVISQNGVVIESDNTSAVSGQTALYDLSAYSVGEYTLFVETGGDVIAEYSITIEEE
jgi:hypothetical protein